MDPTGCAAAFGAEAGGVCLRAALLGWNPLQGAAAQSALAGVMAGFLFSAIVFIFILEPHGDTADGPTGAGQRAIVVGDALPLLLSGFLFLLMASALFAIVESVFHPLKVGIATSLSVSVFVIGGVQTFVALAWLFATTPRTIAAFGAVKGAVRFVAFFSALYLLFTLSKVQYVTHGRHWTHVQLVTGVALLAGPWLATQVLTAVARSVSRLTWRGRGIQALSFWASLLFLGFAVLATIFEVNRQTVTASSAAPAWLVLTVLGGTGLLFALYELSLPPTKAVAQRSSLQARHSRPAVIPAPVSAAGPHRSQRAPHTVTYAMVGRSEP